MLEGLKKFWSYARSGGLKTGPSHENAHGQSGKIVSSAVKNNSLISCLDDYTTSPAGSDAEANAMEGVKKLARNFEDWLMVCQRVSASSALGGFAIEHLILMAVSFEDWKRIYEIDFSPLVRQTALDKLALLAKTNEEQIQVQALAPEDSPIKTSAKEKVKSRAKTVDDWQRVLESSDNDDLRRTAVEAIISLSKDDVESIGSLLDESSEIYSDADLCEIVIAKLRNIQNATLEQWESFYSSTTDDDAETVAITKMIEKISNIDELIKVDEVVVEDDRDDNYDSMYGAKAKEILVTEELCRRIVEEYHSEGTLFCAAFDFLLAKASNTEECFALYIALLDDWNTEDGYSNEDLVEKTIEKLLSVATRSEIMIMSKLGEDRDEFGTLAESAGEKLNT